MDTVESKIYKISPEYLQKFEPMIKKYAQFGGGSDDDKYVKGRFFSSVYEFYIFAFFIGLYKNQFVEIHDEDATRKFWEIENWKPRELVDHLIASAIARSDFDMDAVEHMGEKEVALEVRKIRNVLEAYANGGFSYIMAKVAEDPDHAEQDDFFIKLLA